MATGARCRSSLRVRRHIYGFDLIRGWECSWAGLQERQKATNAKKNSILAVSTIIGRLVFAYQRTRTAPAISANIPKIAKGFIAIKAESRNDPATRPTRGHVGNRSALAGFVAVH